MSERYIKPNTINKSNVYLGTGTKRDRKFYDPSELHEPKRVKFTLGKETDGTIKSPNQKDERQAHEPKTNKGSLLAIDAVNTGLRRSSRLNPEIKIGEELIAL